MNGSRAAWRVLIGAVAIALALPGAAAAGPNDFSTPPGVKAGITFDAFDTNDTNFYFMLKIRTGSPSTFFARWRDSAGAVSQPVLISDPPGTNREIPIKMIVATPSHGAEAWAEWDYLYVGATTNPQATMPANPVWTFGNRAYGMPPGLNATPAPAPTGIAGDPSDISVEAFTLEPHKTCVGWVDAHARVYFGHYGAAGWIQFMHGDGSWGAMHEVRVKPNAPHDEVLTDAFAVRKVLPGQPAIASDELRFYDMGKSMGSSTDLLFPPPAGGPRWKTLASASTPYNPNFIPKPCK